MDLQRVALPPYTDGCQDDPQKVACDYPETELKKIVGTDWAASDSTAVDLVKNFTWTNEDQNVVAGYIAADGMSPQDRRTRLVTTRSRAIGQGSRKMMPRPSPGTKSTKCTTSSTADATA